MKKVYTFHERGMFHVKHGRGLKMKKDNEIENQNRCLGCC